MTYQFRYRIFSVLAILSLLLSALGTPRRVALAASSMAPFAEPSILRQSAVVLVNSQSASYGDFQYFIQPYLDHFGVPYTTLDIATTPVDAAISEYAVIVIGHRALDAGSTVYLSPTEQATISNAVNGGTGLVNFDNALSANGSTARYQFVSDIFTFGYNNATSGTNVTFGNPATNYIIEKHTEGQTITTGTMRLAGITLPGDVTSLASSGTQPFVAVTTYGSGRAVQFGSYDWISHDVKGPLFGLDDLFWRSLVWAARKPFVMQGLPPFVTMRMDDVSGPLWWAQAANDYGFVPWLGLFTNDIDASEAAVVSNLVNGGKATSTIHAFASGTSGFFYFDHNNGRNFSDTVMAGYYADATTWYNSRNIPIGTYVVPHFYEIGSNAFTGLQNWGVKYISTMMNPGQLESVSPWMMAGPFRKYESGSARDLNQNVYYADYVPGYPGFFNCTTEIRDITGYEWLNAGRTSVSVATSDGTEWLKRAMDSMAVADLFSHEYQFMGVISEANWRTILQGITQNIAAYNPIYVSRDYACAYARAVHDSNITGSIYQPSNNLISVDLTGTTDMATKFYVFREDGGLISQLLVDVPAFNGTTQVSYTLPGSLDHITVSPNPASVTTGATQQFTAVGYDANNSPIPNLSVAWSVVNGGGTINPSGLFTAGATPGTYSNTVQATAGSVSGTATVNVTATVLDHFAFDAITGPQYVGASFPVTIRARDAANNPVGTYNGTATLGISAGTVTPTSVTFTNGVWTGNVTVSPQNPGVTLHVQDGSSTGTSNAFDVVAAPACPCSIWNDTNSPANPNEYDGLAVQLGTKFRSSINGYITGIKFYKGSLNTGTHIGQLYRVDGTLLGQVTFTNETASGWQRAYFATPIQITAGTTYIISYHAPSGFYGYTTNSFGSAVNNFPLTALADGTDGPNGVYLYTATPAFPTASFNKSNYWVDAIFETSVGADTTPPVIQIVTPTNGASSISVATTVTASFSESVDPATITSANFELRNASNVLVPASVTYDGATWTAVLTPTTSLSLLTTYTATVKTGVKDLAGNALAANYSWSFTTQAPPPNEGSGGPILVVTSTSNGFGRYYAEILRAEGLNAFTVTDLASVTTSTLNNYDVVILTNIALSAAQATLFADWVTAGGNLIAMRPDARLASLLGLTSQGTSLSDAYLLVNTASGPGVGIVDQTIQYHGTADRYALNGAAAVAMLYSNATTATTNPAVTLRSVGSNGGQAAAFTYDLARSIVYTRQGNPAWSGDERDGFTPIRSDDLFYGNKAGDVQPDWVDLNKVAIPQADEQQRLLVNMIQSMNLDKKPLPRFWYFPRDEKAVVIMTGDDHGSSEIVGRLDHLKSLSPSGCNVADWECVRGTVYLYTQTSQLTNTQAAAYTTDGFEIALHVNTGCADYTPSSLESQYAAQLTTFASKYTSIPAPATHRTHCVVWSDWNSQAHVELAHGIRLDTNYYFWPSTWLNNTPGLFTGSGMPMRFADPDGTTVDIYQATTQMTDESGQSYPETANTLLDRALGAEGYYGAFTANIHVDAGGNGAADPIVTAAQARGVPVISAAQMLAWLDGRNNSSFSAINLQNDVLSFQITAAAGSNGLRAMVPAVVASGSLSSITRNGSAVSYTLQTIKGVQYGFFDAQTGDYLVSYAGGQLPAAFNKVGPANGTSGITETSLTLSWGASSGAASYEYCVDTTNNSACDGSWIGNGTSTSVVVSGLARGQVYYWQVRSQNASGYTYANSDSWWSFTTSANNCPCSIWEDTATPAVAPMNDGQPIEVGTKFRSDTAGYVTALRFYKGAGDTDTHVGHLWTSTGGSPIATVTFTGGTASGWQEMALPTPVQINTNTTYVVSIYSSPLGNFAYTAGGLASGVSNSPLRALAAGEQGPNGVYMYGGGFPTNGSSANYWVDVVFDTTVSSDTTPPVISAISATPGAGGTATISWTTDELATSRVDYGTAPNALTQNATAGTLVTSHSLQLSGLAPGTTYYYRVTSADGANNSATSPDTPAVPLSFTTPVSDTTPPVITNISAVPDASGSLLIAWSTDEAATSRVDYGTAPDALTVNISAAALVTAHSLALSGLAPNTVYYYRVTSADSSNNSATSPQPPAAPLTFTTSAIPLSDDTAAEFGAGTAGACVVDGGVGNGALRLLGTVDESFSGTSLPIGWSQSPWTGGSATVSSGKLTVEGAMAEYTTASSNPAQSLEFLATFTGSLYQHVGLFSDANFSRYAIFSTFNTTNQLYTRTSDGQNILIPGNWLGTPHRYRIDWAATTITFFIDGVQVSQHNVSLTDMRPVVSDYNSDGQTAQLDWLRMSPYASPCTFVSRVLNAGQSVDWLELTYVGSAPAGTTVSFETRTGNTSIPDGTWSAWQTVNSPIASPNGRYIQYRATLAATDPAHTPIIESVSITSATTTTTTVTIAGNTGVADATVGYTDSTPKTVTSDNAGNYSMTVPQGWSGTVTPSKTGYVFTPTSKTYSSVTSNLTGENYAAQLLTYTLSVSKSGSGSGRVTSSPAGIDCGTTCSNSFTFNTAVTLNVVPDTGSTFTGWSGACTGTGSCGFTMDGNKTVTATFAPLSIAPTITLEPVNQTVIAGQTASFSAAASGDPTPTVQWQLSTNGGTSFSDISGATSTTLNVTSQGTFNGYQYRAVFSNVAGAATSQAAILSVTPGAFAKSAPPTGATDQLLTPTLSWNASSGATSYEYCYDTTNDNACSSWVNTGTNQSIAISGLNPSTTYFWQVRAVNTAGDTYANGAATAYWSFSTGSLPGAFNKSSPVSGATGQLLTLTLSWNASSGATSYQYCYDTTNDGACGNWVSTGTSQSVALTGLSQSTTYYWQVRAINSIGTTYANGSATAYSSFSTGSLPGAFNKSSPVSGVRGQPLSLTLSWNASSGATSYEYCYDTTNDGVCSNWVNTGTNRSVTISGLRRNTTYYWQVRSINSIGTTYANGLATAYWSFRTAT